MNRRLTTMSDYKKLVFNTIDCINKDDYDGFYTGVAKIAKMNGIDEETVIFEICKSLYDQGLELMHIRRK